MWSLGSQSGPGLDQGTARTGAVSLSTPTGAIRKSVSLVVKLSPLSHPLDIVSGGRPSLLPAPVMEKGLMILRSIGGQAPEWKLGPKQHPPNKLGQAINWYYWKKVRGGEETWRGPPA